MSKKATLAAFLFAAAAFLLFLSSLLFNHAYFSRLTNDSLFLYEGKQLLAIWLLFGIGLLFMLLIRSSLALPWCLLFAFPCGICLWCFSSFAELLLGIPYRFLPTLLLLGLLLGTLYGIRSRRHSLQALSLSVLWQQTAPLILFFAGFAFLVSAGLLYSFVSYDSYFYFTNYGRTLAILGDFRKIAGDNSFTLTNISQFLPLLNAYTSFWGLDQCYQMQAMLSANVAAAFFYGLYCHSADYLAGKSCNSRLLFPALSAKQSAALYSGLFTLLLVSSTSFVTISSWVLANMYCMAYSFFLFLASFLISHKKHGQLEMTVLISLFLAALTLLRKDGIIFAAFFFLAFCTIGLRSRRVLACLLLPAVVTEGIWLFYVRVLLDAQVMQATFSSIANNKNIFFVICIVLGAYLYLLIGHPLLQWLQKKQPLCSEYTMLFAGMLLLFLLAFVLKDANTIIDNVDFVLRNMFYYPSSWGISALFFAVLLMLSLVPETRLDYLHFLWSGYAFLNLISYCIVDSKWFWLNWDDSYNRVLLQIVPVFVFVMAVKLLFLLRSDTQDHSS